MGIACFLLLQSWKSDQWASEHRPSRLQTFPEAVKEAGPLSLHSHSENIRAHELFWRSVSCCWKPQVLLFIYTELHKLRGKKSRSLPFAKGHRGTQASCLFYN